MDKDARQYAKAAWWRDHAENIPEIGDVADGVSLKLHELLCEYGEYSLEMLGPEPAPPWWPKNRKTMALLPTARFKDEFARVSPKNWVRYVERFDRETFRSAAPRHRPDNVEPAHAGRRGYVQETPDDLLRALLAELVISQGNAAKSEAIKDRIRPVIKRLKLDPDKFLSLPIEKMAALVEGR